MKFRPLLSLDWSGKIGNQVASRVRGGVQYLRELVIPHNPNTFMQSVTRAALQSASKIWRNVLTDLQREEWWDAVTGSGTGQSLFVRFNQPRITAINSRRLFALTQNETGPVFPDDPTIILEPPSASGSTELTNPTTAQVTAATNSIIIPLDAAGGINPNDSVWTGSTVDKPALYFVYASHEQHSSRLSRQHGFQLVGVGKVAKQSLGQTFDQLNIGLSPLGFIATEGRVMYVKAYAVNANGERSPTYEQRVTITA
jgi:hypothetical protein